MNSEIRHFIYPGGVAYDVNVGTALKLHEKKFRVIFSRSLEVSDVFNWGPFIIVRTPGNPDFRTPPPSPLVRKEQWTLFDLNNRRTH